MLPTTACVAPGSMALARAVRVGYCVDSFEIGGTELNAVRTLEALDRRRFQVTVFHLHETGPLRARYEALGLQLLHLPIGRLYSPRTAGQGVRFLRLLRREGIEVVHTHDLYTNIFRSTLGAVGGLSRHCQSPLAGCEPASGSPATQPLQLSFRAPRGRQ